MDDVGEAGGCIDGPHEGGKKCFENREQVLCNVAVLRLVDQAPDLIPSLDAAAYPAKCGRRESRRILFVPFSCKHSAAVQDFKLVWEEE